MPFGGITASATNSVFGGGRLPSPSEPSTSKDFPRNVTSPVQRITKHSKEVKADDSSEGNSPPKDAKNKLKSKLKQKLGDIEPAKLFAQTPVPHQVSTTTYLYYQVHVVHCCIF